MKYKHVVWEFSDKEIDQVVELIKWWSTGPFAHSAIDRRRFTKNVQDYATRVGLLDWRCERHGGRGETVWDACEDCRRVNARFRLVAPEDLRKFSPKWNAPNEALWRIVRDNILEGAEHKGYSAAMSKGWHTLNIFEEGHKWATPDCYREKLDILHALDVAGYIHFQWAGDIWDIQVRKEHLA